MLSGSIGSDANPLKYAGFDFIVDLIARVIGFSAQAFHKILVTKALVEGRKVDLFTGHQFIKTRFQLRPVASVFYKKISINDTDGFVDGGVGFTRAGWASQNPV